MEITGQELFDALRAMPADTELSYAIRLDKDRARVMPSNTLSVDVILMFADSGFRCRGLSFDPDKNLLLDEMRSREYYSLVKRFKLSSRP
jgi:hypothetical protein